MQPGIDEPDSAVLGVALDAGPSRPPTAKPYDGPQCAPSTAGGAAPPGSAAAQAEPAGGAGADPSAPADPEMADASAPSPLDAATTAPTAGLPRPSRGDLVITELMVDPQAVSDTEGEWVELWNPGADSLDLTGCQLDDGGSALRTLPELAIAPMQWLVIARAAHAGLVPDVILSLSLTNAMDRVAVVCDGVTIDEVAYGPGFPLVAGASLSLDPDFANADDNDAPSAWCAASTAFGADRATPGEPNPSCDTGGDPADPDAGGL